MNEISAEEQIWGGTFYGIIQKRPVNLNVRFGLTSHRCAIFKDGWDLIHYVGLIDGKDFRLKVLQRGWFQTSILLTIKGESLMLKTSNKFGDMLRPHFGGEAYS